MEDDPVDSEEVGLGTHEKAAWTVALEGSWSRVRIHRDSGNNMVQFI